MDRRQRNVLIGLASTAAALAVVLLVAVLAGDGKSPSRQRVASAGTTAPSETTSTTSPTPAPTTIALAPLDTTPTALAPATTAAASTTTTAPGPVVTGAGAVLQPPPAPVTRVIGSTCESLADPGWTATCGVAHARRGDLVWLVESGSGGAGHRASVWASDGTAAWRQALVANDDDGSRFAHVGVRVADISGDGFDELAFGFTSVGSRPTLLVDVVDGSQAVVAHRAYAQGAARVTTGQLDGWFARDGGWLHEVVRYAGDAWRVVSSTAVDASAVPPSQL